MAGKALSLKIPQLVHGTARSVDYPSFVSATFYANGQNKSLMDKEVLDRAWKDSAMSQMKTLGAAKVDKLSKQPFLGRNKAVWKRYLPKKIHIPKPGLAEAGIKQIEVKGVAINVPLFAFTNLSKADYVRFVQTLLPRVNPPSLRVDKEMADAAWNELLTHISKAKAGTDSGTVRDARNQAKSKSAAQYWKNQMGEE
ncbi:hypothetical protein MMC30_001853 [Trapelia coarctata]|nr:hypothetical protein [Trapelia coarctata]